MIGGPIVSMFAVIILFVVLLAIAPVLSAGLRKVSFWIGGQEHKVEDAWKEEPLSKHEDS